MSQRGPWRINIPCKVQKKIHSAYIFYEVKISLSLSKHNVKNPPGYDY